MRLTDRQRQVLLAVQFHADAPVRVLRRKTGLRDHTIHYYLQRFRDDGTIRQAAFINIAALGLTQYSAYFSLPLNSPVSRDDVFDYLSHHRQVAWYAELGGHYQFAFTVSAAAPVDIRYLLDAMARKFGVAFQRRAISVLHEFSVFPKNYLEPDGRFDTSQVLTFRESDPPVKIDALDRSILGELFSQQDHCASQIARRLEIPRTTVDFRIARMREQGLVSAIIFHINTHKFGMLTYRVLLSCAGSASQYRDQIFAYSAGHPSIVNFTACTGTWDFELTVEVEQASEVSAISSALASAANGALSEIQVVPVFEQGQSQRYLQNTLRQPDRPAPGSALPPVVESKIKKLA